MDKMQLPFKSNTIGVWKQDGYWSSNAINFDLFREKQGCTKLYMKKNKHKVKGDNKPDFIAYFGDALPDHAEQIKVEAGKVQHGHWIKGELIKGLTLYDYIACSVCGKKYNPDNMSNYCPDCGARLDGKMEFKEGHDIEGW